MPPSCEQNAFADCLAGIVPSRITAFLHHHISLPLSARYLLSHVSTSRAALSNPRFHRRRYILFDLLLIRIKILATSSATSSHVFCHHLRSCSSAVSCILQLLLRRAAIGAPGVHPRRPRHSSASRVEHRRNIEVTVNELCTTLQILPQLHSVSIDSIRLSSNIMNISTTGAQNTLRHLRLRTTIFSDEALRDVLEWFPELDSLTLEGCCLAFEASHQEPLSARSRTISSRRTRIRLLSLARPGPAVVQHLLRHIAIADLQSLLLVDGTRYVALHCSQYQLCMNAASGLRSLETHLPHCEFPIVRAAVRSHTKPFHVCSRYS